MIRMISSALKSLVRLVLVILLTPYKLAKYLSRGVMPASRTSTSWLWWFTREMLMVPVWVIRTFLKEIWTVAKTTYRLILRSPRQTYNKFVFYRDWVMVKVEYLQGESNKWKNFFTTLKAPYSLLRAMGFSPQFATSILAAGSIAGGGVAVAEVLEPPSFSAGHTGIYNAPSDIPSFWEEQYNTLRIDLGAIPVSEISISNVSAGTSFTGGAIPANETTVLQVGGNPTAENFTATWLEVGTLNFERNRCKTLTLSDINAHTINIIGNSSDGQSISVSAGSAAANRQIGIGGGHHQADAMITEGGLYDRIWLQVPISGQNGRINTLTLKNIWTRGADCELSRIKVGELNIIQNETGHDESFLTKEFVVETSVTAAHTNIIDNIEMLIAEPAVQ